LNDRSKITLPRPTATTVDSLNNNTIAGLTTLNDVTWFEKVQCFFGYIMPNNKSSTSDKHLPAGTTKNYQLVWSPYSVTPVFDTDPEETDYSSTKSFFLMNARTIFGTDVPLLKANDGLESLPIN